MGLRIATWNVNSVRPRLGHLERFVAEQSPDVICLQETKVANETFPADPLKALGYGHQLIQGQKSYNGVAILSRHPFETEETRIWCGKDDKRHAAVRLADGLELHNFYVPSGGPTPDPEKNEKFAHKLTFLEEMRDWIAGVSRDQALLLVGDLNVAPLETDVWNHKKLLRSVGHTPGESQRLADLLEAGKMTDVPRHFVPPSEPLYTWWGYRFAQSVAKNYGWRLDHAFANAAAMGRVSAMRVVKDTRLWEQPSDHVPVLIDLD